MAVTLMDRMEDPEGNAFCVCDNGSDGCSL
jgi:hypothetical protein